MDHVSGLKNPKEKKINTLCQLDAKNLLKSKNGSLTSSEKSNLENTMASVWLPKKMTKLLKFKCTGKSEFLHLSLIQDVILTTLLIPINMDGGLHQLILLMLNMNYNGLDLTQFKKLTLNGNWNHPELKLWYLIVLINGKSCCLKNHKMILNLCLSLNKSMELKLSCLIWTKMLEKIPLISMVLENLKFTDPVQLWC